MERGFLAAFLQGSWPKGIALCHGRGTVWNLTRETEQSETWGLLAQSFSLFQNQKGWASTCHWGWASRIIFLIRATKLKGCNSANFAEISVSDGAWTFQRALLESLSAPEPAVVHPEVCTLSYLFMLWFPLVHQHNMLWTFLITKNVIWQNILHYQKLGVS